MANNDQDKQEKERKEQEEEKKRRDEGFRQAIDVINTSASIIN